jgi:hypothetical protein
MVKTLHGKIKVIFLVVAMVLVLPLSAMALTVDIYSGLSSGSAGGAPYSDFVGSFTSPDILFATDTGYNWHPYDLFSFGADITGTLNVSSLGNYIFTLNSDDGSMLYIDGSLVVNNGGAHGPQSINGVASLAAGIHTFEVQFYEDFGGPSGVDLYLPQGVSYGGEPVPEPSTVLLLCAGLGGLLILRRKPKN